MATIYRANESEADRPNILIHPQALTKMKLPPAGPAAHGNMTGWWGSGDGAQNISSGFYPPSPQTQDMNKAEIVTKITKDAGISKGGADKVLTSFIDGVSKTLKKGQNVSLVGFSTFTIGKRKARKGRNPQIGKEIIIPANKVAKFKPGKALREAVQ